MHKRREEPDYIPFLLAYTALSHSLPLHRYRSIVFALVYPLGECCLLGDLERVDQGTIAVPVNTSDRDRLRNHLVSPHSIHELIDLLGSYCPIPRLSGSRVLQVMSPF